MEEWEDSRIPRPAVQWELSDTRGSRDGQGWIDGWMVKEKLDGHCQMRSEGYGHYLV